MPRDPKFWPTDPKFCGKFESEHRSGFQVRNGELKGSGVSGSEGDNSPFRGARPKLISYSDSPYPKPYSTHFLVPTGFSGGFTRIQCWRFSKCRTACKFSDSSKNRERLVLCTRMFQAKFSHPRKCTHEAQNFFRDRFLRFSSFLLSPLPFPL